MKASAPVSNETAAQRRPLRLAMLGMIAGNGHPYSWSAIVNGFDPVAMAQCPYASIPEYLGAAQRGGKVGLPDARVTHIWTDQAQEAPRVAAASLIPNVVGRPEEVIGQVDAVLIATDDGFNHVRRARPFVEAGLPVFVDKPLALTLADLETFIQWERSGARILSSSGLRYAPELDGWVQNGSRVGELRWISAVTCNAWENYGIHALEPVYRILGPGFESIRLERRGACEIVHLLHRSGAHVTLPVIADGGGSFGAIQACGTTAAESFRLEDVYTAFRRQMASFIAFARDGVAPYPFAETVELMTILIAGIRSREEGGQRVELEGFRTRAAKS